jgi:hypothetical protein
MTFFFETRSLDEFLNLQQVQCSSVGSKASHEASNILCDTDGEY